MRLGMVITSWGKPCGVGEYGKALVESVNRLGQPVSVLTARPQEAAAQAEALGMDLVHLQYEYNLYDARELSTAVAGLARQGIASAVTVHSWVPEAANANNFLRELPNIIVPLPGMRMAMQRGGIDPSRVTVIPIGIRSHPLPPRQAVRVSIGLGSEPAVGFFGFFHRHKGIENLTLAVRALRNRYPGLTCFLFANVAPNDGSRQAHESVRAFLDANGLREGVIIQTGYLTEDDVVRRLHAMDVNVLPYQELGGVQASAAIRTVLAARRPTVVTDTAHFSDLGDEVYKIPDNHPDRIAGAITDILDNQDRSRALTEASARLGERDSWENVAAAHQRYYRALLRNGGGRGLQAAEAR